LVFWACHFYFSEKEYTNIHLLSIKSFLSECPDNEAVSSESLKATIFQSLVWTILLLYFYKHS
ncbi:MAG: hypothetical protein AAGI90_06890, partial [Chlamydiota bacterium]